MKAFLIAALMSLATQAWAADPDSDSLTIRITPNVDMGVDVDTSTARFNHADSPGDLDVPLDLNTTAYLISPASVTITGNFGNQEVELVASSLDTWAIDSDESIGTDSVQLYGLFTVNKTTNPAESDFAGANNLITTSPSMAGQPVADEGAPGTNEKYEKAFGLDQWAQMDNMAVGTVRQLWLRLDTPSMTSVDTSQGIYITLTAKSGVSN